MIRSREKTHFFVFIDPNFKQKKKKVRSPFWENDVTSQCMDGQS